MLSTVRTILSTLAVAATPAAASTRPGWEVNWTDEFVGSAIDGSRWEVLHRRDSFNNELQHYTPAQVSVGSGNLTITATNQPLDGRLYRSGLVRTWAEQTYGRWEVRASLPATQGMWPAIWLLPRTVPWPSGGEIDIMENRGSEPTIVGSAYHFGANVSQHRFIARAFGYTVNGLPVSFHNNMHEYAVEWDPSRIRYFVNGIPHFTFYNNTAPISSTPMSLILNLAVGGHYGGDPDGTTIFPQRFAIDRATVYRRNPATAQLINSSFEQTAGSHFTEWSEYGNDVNVRIDAVTANAKTGSVAAQLFGRFDGTARNNSGLFQELPTTPGEVWQVGAWARNRPGDALAGGNTAGIKVEFIDGNGSVISVGTLDVVRAGSPTVYREFAVRRTAPAGARFVRAVLEMIQVGNARGSVNFDDASLRRAAGSQLLGDINLDGLANAADVDTLLRSLAPANIAFDFSGNGVVDAVDGDRFLEVAFNTRRGDVNLDGEVNFTDLLSLARNYQTAGAGHWAIGDFTGEGDIDFNDLLLIARNYSAAASFSADWSRAIDLVIPEPTWALLPLAMAAAMTRRVRQSNAVSIDTAGPCLPSAARRPTRSLV